MMLFSGSLLLGGVTVTLPMEAHVRGTEIELGEIAQVVGADPEEVDRVAALELGYAPATLSRTIRCMGISPDSPSEGMSYFRTPSLQPVQTISMVAPSSCTVSTTGSAESKIMPLDRNTSSIAVSLS